MTLYHDQRHHVSDFDVTASISPSIQDVRELLGCGYFTDHGVWVFHRSWGVGISQIMGCGYFTDHGVWVFHRSWGVGISQIMGCGYFRVWVFHRSDQIMGCGYFIDQTRSWGVGISQTRPDHGHMHGCGYFTDQTRSWGVGISQTRPDHGVWVLIFTDQTRSWGTGCGYFTDQTRPWSGLVCEILTAPHATGVQRAELEQMLHHRPIRVGGGVSGREGVPGRT